MGRVEMGWGKDGARQGGAGQGEGGRKGVRVGYMTGRAVTGLGWTGGKERRGSIIFE